MVKSDQLTITSGVINTQIAQKKKLHLLCESATVRRRNTRYTEKKDVKEETKQKEQTAPTLQTVSSLVK